MNQLCEVRHSLEMPFWGPLRPAGSPSAGDLHYHSFVGLAAPGSPRRAATSSSRPVVSPVGFPAEVANSGRSAASWPSELSSARSSTPS
jgi:hypothetical protein